MRVKYGLGQSGFTLIEILIALVVSSIIMTGVFTAFLTQQDIYAEQEQVAEMQQNIRVGLDFMVHEIRMAGYRGSGGSTADFIAAEADALAFSADMDENGSTGSDENFAFDLYGRTLGYLSNDQNTIILTETPGSSGHYEASATSSSGGAVNHQPIAENIEKLEFFYTLDNGTQTFSPTDPSDIRSVEISILARARRPDPDYTDNNVYCPASNPTFNTGTSLCENLDTGTTLSPWGASNDSFRRRFQTMTVQCRNMGL